MQPRKIVPLIVLWHCLLLAAVAVAADDNRIKMEMSISKQVTTMVEGREQISYIPVAQVNPGNRVRYDVSYTNISSEEVHNFAIVDPIPAGVVYLSDQGDGNTTTLFSIDKGFSYSEAPLFHEVRDRESGLIKKEEVGADKYTHIKWLFKGAIKPGQQGKVSFLATVK